MDLAPVADLDDGPSSGVIGDRSFSADPTVAANYAYAYAAGLADGGILPVAKHFPGQGRSSEDIHFRAASVTVTLDALQSSDLRPFDALIRAGIPAVMMNHLRYSSLDPNLPASLSPRAYQLLRGLGFRGAAITDSVGMAAVNRPGTWPRPRSGRWRRAPTACSTPGGGRPRTCATGWWRPSSAASSTSPGSTRRRRGWWPSPAATRATVTCLTGDLAAGGGLRPPEPGGPGPSRCRRNPHREQTQLGPVAASPAKQGQR